MFNRLKSTLFVPKSPNYPGFDFFIWDPSGSELMAFQITIKKPFISHKTTVDGTSENCELWLSFCFGGDSVRKPMKVFWIIPTSCVKKAKVFQGHATILVEDLYDEFPSLKRLNFE